MASGIPESACTAILDGTTVDSYYADFMTDVIQRVAKMYLIGMLTLMMLEIDLCCNSYNLTDCRSGLKMFYVTLTANISCTSTYLSLKDRCGKNFL